MGGRVEERGAVWCLWWRWGLRGEEAEEEVAVVWRRGEEGEEGPGGPGERGRGWWRCWVTRWMWARRVGLVEGGRVKWM